SAAPDPSRTSRARIRRTAPSPARRRRIEDPRVRVVRIEREGLPVAQELLERVRGDREVEPLREEELPGDHADHLAPQVEQGPAGVAGVHLRRRLDVGPTGLLAARAADDPLGDRALEAERVADREDRLTHAEIARVSQEDLREGRPLLAGLRLELEESEV